MSSFFVGILFGVVLAKLHERLETTVCPRCRRDVRDLPLIGTLHLCEYPR